ncbi:hypothetical protein ABZ770_16500 [Streptomyces sp. NPDC006654]|uniref:hypothetical protein n=1 Tax=Streptomyces sp. NPDC006654 TaxID=3156897 RepID=UPI0033D5D039
MSAVILGAVIATAFARGRWTGPWWLMLLAAIVIYPVSHTLLEHVEEAPGGWLRLAFQVGCVGLVSTLISPLYHRLRSRDAQAGKERGDGSEDIGSSDAL